MVYKASDLTIRIGRRPGNVLLTISDMESISISVDNTVAQWTPLDMAGWSRRLNTGRSVTISLSGKRNMANAGNNLVATMGYESNVSACLGTIEVAFPGGSVLRMSCIVNVTACGGGAAEDLGVLEFECLSDGQVTYS